MPMSDEERRAKNRERQARFRAAQREKSKLEALPRIGPGGRDGGGAPHEPSMANEIAAKEFLDMLAVPASEKPRAALLLTLARDLDSGAVAQRSAIAQRYDEVMEKLVAAARPRERDELDELRRSFYTGSVDGIDDDPEATGRRAVRKKA